MSHPLLPPARTVVTKKQAESSPPGAAVRKRMLRLGRAAGHHRIGHFHMAACIRTLRIVRPAMLLPIPDPSRANCYI